jgi:hypothetical protein
LEGGHQQGKAFAELEWVFFVLRLIWHWQVDADQLYLVFLQFSTRKPEFIQENVVGNAKFCVADGGRQRPNDGEVVEGPLVFVCDGDGKERRGEPKSRKGEEEVQCRSEAGTDD